MVLNYTASEEIIKKKYYYNKNNKNFIQTDYKFTQQIINTEILQKKNNDKIMRIKLLNENIIKINNEIIYKLHYS